MFDTTRPVILLAIASFACGGESAGPPPPQQATHRIGVRAPAGVGEFYDRPTGALFTPRGNNYVRLAPQVTPEGNTVLYHATFNPSLYDATRVESALAQMQSSGYNSVRVWINHCCREGSVGDPAGGLSATYVANVVDFLKRAKVHEVSVVLTVDDVPKVGGYQELFNLSCCTLFAGTNLHYLTQGGLDANRKFWRDFSHALMVQQAPLDAILAYELRNELSFESNLPPLSLTSGTVTTVNGQTYDMADPAAKQRMMDENMVYWIDQIGAAIGRQIPPRSSRSDSFSPRGRTRRGLGIHG